MRHDAIDKPSEWVARWLGLLAPLIPAGDMLDLACGSGRHARLLAESGHPVIALDRDITMVTEIATPGITPFRHDLEQDSASWPFEAERFAVIVVTNYLHRPLFPHIVESLAPGGVLIYETFAQGNELLGKPSNPAFLLAPGELLDFLRPAMHIVAYEDGYIDRPKPAMVQRICAVKPEPGLTIQHLRLA
jgi:SAM-dependent methyltransferase